MDHPITIGRFKTSLTWSQEIAKRFAYRLQTLGGHPSERELTDPNTANAAVCKILWALLPGSVLGKFKTPEDLFVEIDQDKDASTISEAIAAIYAEMVPDAEKKSTLKKSHSQKSNSASAKKNGTKHTRIKRRNT